MSAAQYEKFETLLDCLDHWAAAQPNKVYFTQPFSAEKTVDYTWAQVADQVIEAENPTDDLVTVDRGGSFRGGSIIGGKSLV